MDPDYLTDRTFHTPDRFILARSDKHIVLGCGRIDEKMPAYCTAYTVEKMSLFIRKEDDRVIPIRLPHCPRARIAGALYSLTTDQIEKLDNRLQNRIQFDRKLVPVYVQNGKTYEQYQEPVWMYIGKPEFWQSSIQNNTHPLLGGNFYEGPYDNAAFDLADRHMDNDRILHNHYRVDPRRIEDAVVQVTAEINNPSERMRQHVKELNNQEVNRSKWFRGYNRLNFLRKKFRKKLNECAD